MKKESKEIQVFCPYCGDPALWVSNEEIYNGKRYGKSYMAWYCRPCDAHVGCHNNTRVPLGVMANRELRQWRMKVHAKIDPIWKSGQMHRGQLYALISRKLGRTYHTGESDIETCKQILSMDLNS